MPAQNFVQPLHTLHQRQKNTKFTSFHNTDSLIGLCVYVVGLQKQHGRDGQDLTEYKVLRSLKEILIKT